MGRKPYKAVRTPQTLQRPLRILCRRKSELREEAGPWPQIFMEFFHSATHLLYSMLAVVDNAPNKNSSPRPQKKHQGVRGGKLRPAQVGTQWKLSLEPPTSLWKSSTETRIMEETNIFSKGGSDNTHKRYLALLKFYLTSKPTPEVMSML